MSTSVMWFRRDLRLADNPALLAAVEAGPDGVLPLFVLDPVPFDTAGAPRAAYLLRSLRALDEAMAGALHIRRGHPVDEVLAAARAVGAREVHIAADYGPYGRTRDEKVEAVLGAQGIALHRTGSPYAVAPGRVRKPDGTPYRVFTPFSKAWRDHGWRRPAEAPGDGMTWLRPSKGAALPRDPALGGTRIPDAGESAATDRLEAFLDDHLGDYADQRDRPDRPGTSHLSMSLKYGEVHPRTILAHLSGRRGQGPQTFSTELCWRDFYADVVFHEPQTIWEPLNRQVGRISTDSGSTADAHFSAWTEGRTGYPIVDAGMRQLLSIGWMHNRVRMITASFLVKDLHLPWQRGAEHFLAHLVDGDYASNNHGWQWVAGTGTDAAPYFRIFNPVTQGQKFDPDGGYVRQWVPELADVAGRKAHEPWSLPDGLPAGYPERIVDHAEARAEALARYEQVRAARQP